MKRRALVVVRNAVGGGHHIVVVGAGKAFHLLMERRILVSIGGVFVMLAATAAMEWHPSFVPHAAWECTMYCVHSIAFYPIMKPIEPLLAWLMSSGGQAAVENAVSEAVEAAEVVAQ